MLALVAEGRSAGELYFLAEELRARGKRVDMIIGADTQENVFKPIEGKRLSRSRIRRSARLRSRRRAKTWRSPPTSN